MQTNQPSQTEFHDACTHVLNGGMQVESLPVTFVTPSEQFPDVINLHGHSPFLAHTAPHGSFGLVGDFALARQAMRQEGEMYATDLRFASTDHASLDGDENSPPRYSQIGVGTRQVIIAGDIPTAAAINYFTGDSAVALAHPMDFEKVVDFFKDQGVDHVVLYPSNTDTSRLYARAASVKTGASIAAITSDHFPARLGLMETLRTANASYSNEPMDKADAYLSADVERLIIDPIKNARPIARSQNKALTPDNGIQR